MTLKTQMTADLAAFFNSDEFAETVTYTPAGGEATSITGIITKDQFFQEPYVRGENMAGCEIAVKASEVAAPQHGDTFVIGSDTWDLDPTRGVIYEDDDIFIIALERRL